jgi:hypothetical protein
MAASHESFRIAILPVIELNYRFFKDWMSFFNISSLLGECFCNKAAFETLRRLSEISEEHPRSFIPHGFEHIVSDSKDADLAKMAWVELQRMKTDSSESVRGEVEISIQRLIGKNIQLANNES